MYSGHAAELGTGMGDASGIDGDGDVDGLFGSILSVVKSVASPVATFVGGAVGTVIAPGLGTAAGAYLGGKLGGAIASSGEGGGGGGGAPAYEPNVRAVATSRITAAQQAARDHGGPSSPSTYRPPVRPVRRVANAADNALVAETLARIKARKQTTLTTKMNLATGNRSMQQASKALSPAAKIAIGTGGVGAVAALALWAYRASML